MKSYLLILFAVLINTSCKEKEEPLEPVKEKVKLYIIAGTGIIDAGAIRPTMQITGTSIETVNNASGTRIIEVNYNKGESQSVTVKGSQIDAELYLEVSKGLSLIPSQRVAYKMRLGSVSVSFVAN